MPLRVISYSSPHCKNKLKTTTSILNSGPNAVFSELKFRGLPRKNDMAMQRGYATATLLFLSVLFPFLKKRLADFWSGTLFNHPIETAKYTFYRFLNHERFNRRTLPYNLFCKSIVLYDQAPQRRKVLIVEDTITAESGKKIFSRIMDGRSTDKAFAAPVDQRFGNTYNLIGHQCLLAIIQIHLCLTHKPSKNEKKSQTD